MSNLFSTEAESAGADNPIPTWLTIDPADLVLKRESGAIGEGSFGAVYEASWRGLRVAAKEMPREARDLFESEASILAKLQSPFIVPFIGTCIKDSHLYLVMELVSSNLQKLLEDRSRRGRPPLSLPVAVDIMLQISKAMEYLHSQEIMHLDLKASNVLFEPSVPESREEGYGRVKLCDFGTASPRLFSFRAPDPKGTCYWRAPEVFPPPSQDWSAETNIPENYTNQDASAETNTPEIYTYKADVYSFAMTCYEILTGKQPFSGVLPREVYTKIVNGERPTLNPSICPFILANYIQQCWETDPDHRPCFEAVSKFLWKLTLWLSNFPLDWNKALNDSFFPDLGFVDGEKKSIFSLKLEKWKQLDLAAMYSRLGEMLVKWRFLSLQMRRGIAIDIASFLASIHGNSAKRFLDLCLDSSTIFLDWKLKPIFSGGHPGNKQEEFTNIQMFGGILVELSTGCIWTNMPSLRDSIQGRRECFVYWQLMTKMEEMGEIQLGRKMERMWDRQLVKEIVDWQLVKETGEMGKRQLWEVLRWWTLGLWCLSKSPSEQPNIQTVLQLLKESDPFHLPPGSTLRDYLSPIPSIEEVIDLSCPCYRSKPRQLGGETEARLGVLCPILDEG